MYVAMATMGLFWLLFENLNPNVFQVIPPERKFLWDNLLSVRHHNTIRSSIKANVRTVTMKSFENIILLEYGHEN